MLDARQIASGNTYAQSATGAAFSALGCIIYELVKAHGKLPTALADTKSSVSKAEATVESLVTASNQQRAPDVPL